MRYTVCPKCFRRVYGIIQWSNTDNYGRKLRSYIGHCCDCECDFEVRQFAQGRKWIIYMWREFIWVISHGQPMEWNNVNDLPLPEAAVITGPGGDYNRQSCKTKEQLKQRLSEALTVTQKQADSIRKSLEELT